MMIATKRYIYLIFIISVVIAVLFIASRYFNIPQFYSLFTTGKAQIVLLEPEMKLYKRKPEYPGGIEIPNSDSLIYEKLRDSSKKVSINQVNLLPEPEKPIEKDLQNLRFIATGSEDNIKLGDNIDLSRENEPRFVESIDDILENIGYYEENFIVPETEEEKIQSQALLAKDEVISGESKGEQEKNYGNIKLFKSYSAVHHTDVESSDYRLGQGYLIQLAIARSSDQANKVWMRIKAKHNKILAKNTLIVKKIYSKENKIFYLVLTGPYSSEYKAKLVCSSLKKKQQNCIIIK